MTRKLLLAVAAAALLVPCVALAAPQATLAEARIGGASIEFAPQVDFSRAVLTVSTPGGQVLRFEGVGTVPSFGLFDAKGQPHADGAYQWELRLSPRMTPELRKELRASRARGEEGSIGDRVVSGSFAIAGGAFVDPGEREAPAATVEKAITPTTAADQVIPDDLIVQGSGCFGFDCVNNENFGFDTIRMKENNLRIDFTDTSVGTFPTQDWEIAANDSASGGRNALIVSDENNQIVVVESGNVSNALYIDDGGRIGMRTSTPVLDLHISTSNTPAIRLEQTNAGGFTAQTWDIAGNEANFFVRDVTGGSRLPFRIRPGAPTSSLDISSDGEVGIGGVAADGTELHVISGESRFDSASATLNSHFNFSGNGQNYFRGTTIIADDAVGSHVGIGCDSPQADLVVGANAASCAGGAFTAITAGSAPVTSSSRSFKTNLAAVAVPGILEKVQQVGVFTFDFINGPADRLGLMAEDFHTIFQRGSDKVIDSGEVTSALWLAVQELVTRNQELTERLKALEARLPAEETQKQ